MYSKNHFSTSINNKYLESLSLKNNQYLLNQNSLKPNHTNNIF